MSSRDLPGYLSCVVLSHGRPRSVGRALMTQQHKVRPPNKPHMKIGLMRQEKELRRASETKKSTGWFEGNEFESNNPRIPSYLVSRHVSLITIHLSLRGGGSINTFLIVQVRFGPTLTKTSIYSRHKFDRVQQKELSWSENALFSFSKKDTCEKNRSIPLDIYHARDTRTIYARATEKQIRSINQKEEKLFW